MKPLNLDNNSCSPISSNCVIWQGPNIPCIKLCTGDTITDVIHALATELCNIVDQVDISTLDLSCLDITTGEPANLNELLQILINKICSTNSIPVPAAFTTGGNPPCPTTCIVPVAQCLQTNGQTTMKLLDYVQLIGNRICSILASIGTINNSITNLTTRVTILESVPPTPPYILPSVTPDCTLADGSVVSGTAYKLDIILQALINDDNHGYCALLSSTGQPSEITQAYLSQPIFGTDVALSQCNITLAQKFSTSWFTSPNNLSKSFTDLWLTVKDLRDAYKTYKVVAGNSNVTVTPTTNVAACGPEVQFAVSAKSSSVVAGTNVSVTSNEVAGNTTYTVNATSKNTTVIAGDNIIVAENTTDPANTIYTVTGKEAIVTASTDTTNTVTVTPTTSGNDTTYAVYSKYGLDTFVMGWSMEKDRFCPWFDIPAVAQGSSSAQGCTTNYTDTGYSIPESGGGYKMIKPNIVQTTGNVGVYANKNVSVTHIGIGEYLTTAEFNDYGCTFGTLNSDQGTFTVNQSGVYTISAYCHFKSVCKYSESGSEGRFFWSATNGQVGLGIVNRANTTDIFCGNFQTVIANKTTQIDITVSRTVYINSGTILGINVLNATDRTYTPNQLDGGDGIGFQIIKLSEDITSIAL
jgi:hypothetical protein